MGFLMWLATYSYLFDHHHYCMFLRNHSCCRSNIQHIGNRWLDLSALVPTASDIIILRSFPYNPVPLLFASIIVSSESFSVLRILYFLLRTQ